MADDDPLASADPLEALPPPERVNYATGVLLDAEDFRAEQTYHRGRLAAALRALSGFGTIGGLRVRAPAAGDGELQLRVDPGLAIDPLGRLVELRVPQCIRLARWFAAQPDGALANAVQRAPSPAVLVDVFLEARDCARGKTPAFATGPFDALDAVVPARLAETGELSLVPRVGAGAPPAPQNFWPDASAGREARLQAVLDGWSAGADSDGPISLPEHVEGQDPASVFLARVRIPVSLPAGAARPALDLTARVSSDNSTRPFIFLPGKWLGRPFAAEPLVQP